jgi:hypothetical protein
MSDPEMVMRMITSNFITACVAGECDFTLYPNGRWHHFANDPWNAIGPGVGLTGLGVGVDL